MASPAALGRADARLAGASRRASRWHMQFAETLAPVVDLVFPPRCPLCGEGLSAQVGLCAACWNELVIPGEPACALCQRPLRRRRRRGRGLRALPGRAATA